LFCFCCNWIHFLVCSPKKIWFSCVIPLGVEPKHGFGTWSLLCEEKKQQEEGPTSITKVLCVCFSPLSYFFLFLYLFPCPCISFGSSTWGSTERGKGYHFQQIGGGDDNKCIAIAISKAQVLGQFSLNNNSKNKKIGVGMGEEAHLLLLHLCH